MHFMWGSVCQVSSREEDKYTNTLSCVWMCVFPAGANVSWCSYEQCRTMPPWGCEHMCVYLSMCVSVCNWVDRVGSRPFPPLLYPSVVQFFLGKRLVQRMLPHSLNLVLVFDLFIFQMNTAWNFVPDLLKSLLKRCCLAQLASDFFSLICLILIARLQQTEMTSSRGGRLKSRSCGRKMRMVNVKHGVHTVLMSCSFFFS